MESIHQETYRGYTINLYPDSFVESPRDHYTLGTMVCWHKRYNLGSDHSYSSPSAFLSDMWIEHGTAEELRALVLQAIRKLDSLEDKKYFLNRANDDQELVQDAELHDHPEKCCPDSIVLLPIYMYEHSGIVLNTVGFSCPWDSGQVGFIYVSRGTLKEEKLAAWSDKEVQDQLAQEVATYSQYLSGDVYTYTIEDYSGEVVGSLGGCYGQEYAIEEAKREVDCLLVLAEQEAFCHVRDNADKY